MSLNDVFSKRGKALPDVFEYTTVPEKFRHQFCHWLAQYLPPDVWFNRKKTGGSCAGEKLYEEIILSLCEEHGLPRLFTSPRIRASKHEAQAEVLAFVTQAPLPAQI